MYKEAQTVMLCFGFTDYFFHTLKHTQKLKEKNVAKSVFKRGRGIYLLLALQESK